MTGTTNPKLYVSLTPSGALQVELPWGQGEHRLITLRAGDEAGTLQRILEARLAAHYVIGDDGAPTASQVRHWERHGIWPDPRCAHCRAEGTVARGNGRKSRAVVLAEHGGVTIRRVPAKSNKISKTQRANSSASLKPP